jgi:hypothetical protein
MPTSYANRGRPLLIANGSPEVLHCTLTPDSTTNIFSGSIAVSMVQAADITGPVYYGYRAWGPNWPFSSDWAKGSGAGWQKHFEVLAATALSQEHVAQLLL